MYSYISGILKEVGADHIVVDNNGIGYFINTALAALADLPELEEEVKVYTQLIHKEDSMSLYGFTSRVDLEVFNMLLTVSGIGPKAAMAILSSMTAEDLKFAIVAGDSTSIARANGVGKKTAERVIIDLKDKISAVDAMEGKLNSAGNASRPQRGQDFATNAIRQEVTEALTALGYSAKDAARALDKMTITESSTVEQLLTDTLKQMSFL
ncbi:MAG: Holliday junction branch migration protein RuvA [Pseudobutyrivibrio sp.]|nr:Holliday junction branch migration protein RuvA [Pseudobutyrivibrio sp.]